MAYVWGSQKAQAVEAYALEYEPLAHARHMPWLELWYLPGTQAMHSLFMVSTKPASHWQLSEPPAEALLLLGHGVQEELWLCLAYVWGSHKAQAVAFEEDEKEPLGHARHSETAVEVRG